MTEENQLDKNQQPLDENQNGVDENLQQGETILRPPFEPIDVSELGIADLEPPAESKLNEVEQLKAELAQAKNNELRAHAELENFRKRMNRQMADERRYASMDLIRELLPTWDNMGRAIEAAEQKHDLDSLIQGVQMMYGQILTILDRQKCEKIESLHQPFDPHLHESIAMHPNADFPANTVIFETQTGFTLHDRVVRPSQVILAAAAPESADNADNADD